MSAINVNSITGRTGTHGPVLTGVTTVTGGTLNTAALNVTGAASFSGNVSIAGTLSYDDVTDIDSVGIITARSGVSITGGDLTLPDAIVHAGDTNTKIRFPAADTFTVETAGSERLRITSAGNVGIGTDNPSADYRVTIKSTTSPHSALLLDTTESNYNTNLYFAKQGTNKWTIGNKADSDSFRFVAGSTERFRITSGGNVGINRTDPNQRLNVNGNIEVNAYDSPGGSGGYYTSKGLIIGNLYDAGKSYTGSDDRTACVWQERGLDLDFATNDALRMKITYGGDVGIGTATPTNIANFTSFTLDGTTGGNIEFKDNGVLRGSVYNLTDQFIVQAQGSSTPLAFRTNSTERLRITSAGKVGIDNNNPNAKLEVKGSGGSTGLTFRGTDSSGNTNFWVQDGGSVGVHYYPFEINQDYSDSATPSSTYFYIHGNSPFIVKSDGKVGIGLTTPGDYYPQSNDLVVGTTSGNRGISIVSGTTATGSIVFADSTANFANRTGQIVYDHSTNSLELFTSAEERLRITSDGKFGFKTTSPDYTVDINGELGIKEGQPVTWHDGSGNAAAQIYGDSSSNLIFRTGVAAMGERMRLLPAGGLTFNGDTSSANALDDYEEGSWTPTAESGLGIISGTWAATGRYVKIGRQVTVEFVQTSGTVSFPMGALILSGLPYNASTGGNGSVGAITNDSPNLSVMTLIWTSGRIYAVEAGTNQTGLRFAATYQTDE